ncbi:MAG: pantetheine-phosphate adenylyltransferase [Flavobacteriales bacterium]|nr:pantetheine-phosphate adenylyltransferase [Flavobacteriales bacterium]
MEKIAVFPGSFDPLTRGHESIIKRALPLFDKIVVAIGVNSSKNYMFSLEQRIDFCKKTFIDSNISIETYEGLTIDFCSKIGARYLLRGLRTSADFEFERGIAQMNSSMNTEIETVFMLAPPELSPVSSTIVRDIIKNGGDVSQFVPKGISF